MDFRIYENYFKATHRLAKIFIKLEYDENLDVLRFDDRYEPIENIKYVYFKDGCIRVGYKNDTYKKGRIDYFTSAEADAICEFLVSKGVNAMNYSEYLQWHRKEAAMRAEIWKAEAEAKKKAKEAEKKIKNEARARQSLKYSAYSENNGVKKRTDSRDVGGFVVLVGFILFFTCSVFM